MNSGLAGLSHRFTSRLSLQLPSFAAWVLLFGLVCLFWFGGVCVLCFVFCFWGALDDFFLTSSSWDMTATVFSNAALETKPLVLKGSRPCGGVRARMPIGQFSFQHGIW